MSTIPATYSRLTSIEPLLDSARAWTGPSWRDLVIPKMKGWAKDEFNQLVLDASAKKLEKNQFQAFVDMVRVMGLQGDAIYQLNANEVTRLEREILEVLRWETTIEEMGIDFKQIGPGMTTYKYNKYIDPIPPERTNSFEFKEVASLGKQESTVDLRGMGYRWHIPKTILDATRGGNGIETFNESYDIGLMRELMASLKEYRDRWLFRGTDIPNFTDTGVTGLLNDSGLTDPGAMGAGADDNLTDFGDVYLSAVKLANKLILAKFKPPFDLHLSPGVWSQAAFNINTTSATNISDLQALRLYQGMDGSAMFRSIKINPFMIDSDTETNSTGAMAAYATSSRNFHVVESYPLSVYPLPPVNLGLDGLMFWMGAPVIRRPTSIVFADALTTEVFAA